VAQINNKGVQDLFSDILFPAPDDSEESDYPIHIQRLLEESSRILTSPPPPATAPTQSHHSYQVLRILLVDFSKKARPFLFSSLLIFSKSLNFFVRSPWLFVIELFFRINLDECLTLHRMESKGKLDLNLQPKGSFINDVTQCWTIFLSQWSSHFFGWRPSESFLWISLPLRKIATLEGKNAFLWPYFLLVWWNKNL
jgi:hypothetical protein